MNPGILTHYFRIEQPTDSIGTMGETVQTWSTWTYRRGSLQALSGMELFAASQSQPQTTLKVIMRYCTGLTPRHRLVDTVSNTLYEIASVIDPTGAKREHHLQVIESGATA